jgi:hypothetical protein
MSVAPATAPEEKTEAVRALPEEFAVGMRPLVEYPVVAKGSAS